MPQTSQDTNCQIKHQHSPCACMFVYHVIDTMPYKHANKMAQTALCFILSMKKLMLSIWSSEGLKSVCLRPIHTATMLVQCFTIQIYKFQLRLSVSYNVVIDIFT